MAAPLGPQHLARFVVVPVSRTLDIHGRQDLHLAAPTSAANVLVLAFGLIRPLGLDPVRAILAHSVGTMLAYLLYLWFIWRAARRDGLTDGARQGRVRTWPPRRRQRRRRRSTPETVVGGTVISLAHPPCRPRRPGRGGSVRAPRPPRDTGGNY